MKVFTVIGVAVVAVRVVRVILDFARIWSDPDYVQRSWEYAHR